MRLTQYTDYSLRVLMYLALQRGDQISTIQQISEAYATSKNHLMKVVQNLSREGYVESIRGQHGGLRLRRPADSIGLGEVIRLTEPDNALVECFRTGGQCVIAPACGLPAVLNRALRAFYEDLDRYTLADIVSPSSRDLVRLLELPAR